jgi:hypothetical protein
VTAEPLATVAHQHVRQVVDHEALQQPEHDWPGPTRREPWWHSGSDPPAPTLSAH